MTLKHLEEDYASGSSFIHLSIHLSRRRWR